MSLLLAIDTSLEKASVCLAEDQEILSLQTNAKQKDHASWIHTAIQSLFADTRIKMEALTAVAVSIGPGSYTGIRIGLSSAKGICYALHKPLITINTLEMMARAVKDEATDLICPMIDARRMEVFYALFTKSIDWVEPPAAKILYPDSFEEYLDQHQILFTGSGIKKFRELSHNSKKYVFFEGHFDCSQLIVPATLKLKNLDFADLAYSEPLYIKEFHTTAQKPFK
ncbi:MAG: tRNA (adenosine(37)-N6)-threonylcarbamoyltransferase complex dimerization subunit type 1 TsaB [Terrimonas sp.]|nr:tRNA (adenosine(37)-N6)-threonylcarbamoyltransferase complex dimerization subunit type 1 TsaB [Terrimonas sp.]